ncbi:diaminobutyrate--2-oxoglutarate transaminase [Citricoccus sp.]|uniref:diaminobutyrate--2-oxoglutarate transaminase n=1 Tax=Citricoccus sp. TaxID=1978372 RepID=UPI00263A076F|nr:diaminobutyrate--2-oxoglutarate transaminase [Citricoccus sp.]HRO31185.1 diaminobutyrate--2-oxoglutarate transaminase [Citricoccus sp.]
MAHLIDVFAAHESQVRSYCRSFPHVLTTAKGSFVYDREGREYIDFLAGAGTLNYGHNDPDMKSALMAYVAGDGIAHGLDLHTAAKGDFLTAFHEAVLAPRQMDYRVQFTGPTGTNAVEAALKLARKVTGRTNVIAFTNGFHGVSLGSLAATGSSHHRMSGQGLQGVTRMAYDGYHGPDIDTSELLERMLSDASSGVDAPAAIILECVQGEGGLNQVSPAWLRRVAGLAAQHGALLIVDDCQAGCGRTGTFFSFEDMGIAPDLVVLAKSISGFGLPMSVLLIRPDLDRWKPGEHNGTFRGNAHAFVTAEVAIRKFWAGTQFTEVIGRRSELVRTRLEEISGAIPGSRVKGRGMMQGLDVVDEGVSAAVRRTCAANGLLIEAGGPRDEVIKVMAPLTTDETTLDRGLEILRSAVSRHADDPRATPVAG